MSLLGRIAVGIGTGGLSEVGRGVYNAIKPKPLETPPTSGAGSGTYGVVDNPDYVAWSQQKAALDAQAQSDPGWAKSPSGYAASLANLGPAPPQSVQVNSISNTQQQTQASAAAANANQAAAAARVTNAANQIAANANPQAGTTAAQRLQQINRSAPAATPATAPPTSAALRTPILNNTPLQGSAGAVPTAVNDLLSSQQNLNIAPRGLTPTAAAAVAQVAGGTPAGNALPARNMGATLPASTLANQPIVSNGQQIAPHDYSPQVANAVSQISNAANQVSSIGSGTPNYAAQGQAAANRAAPQIQENGAGQAAQQSALSAAQGFQSDTSGIGAIQNAVADTSGAAALSGFDPYRSDNAIAGLNSFDSKNTAAGVQQLQSYNSDNSQAAMDPLTHFYAGNSNDAANQLEQYDPQAANTTAQALTGYQADRSGINALNSYAAEPEGPSAAQALLQSGSDANQRQAISLARSARGGPAAQAQAQRMAISENAATQAQTSGQAAVLRAQETNDYKTRQLSALAQAGSLISQADAQQIQAKAAGGQLLSAQDSQKLAALQTYAQVKTTMDQLGLSADQAAAQLASQMDTQHLSALQSAGQLQSNMDQQRLGALTAAGNVANNADAQSLAGKTSAANILLQGSQINQQGAIAAQNARAVASGQQLQAISLQGQISDQIRTADIDVLKSNLSAQLQQANLNDTQVRAFAQMGEDARQANQNAQLQAAQLGVSAATASSAVDLAWQQFAYQQLTTQQQIDLAKQGITTQIDIANQNATTSTTNALLGLAGTAGVAIGKATSDERAKKNIRSVRGSEVAQALRDSPGSRYEYKEPDKPGRAAGTHTTPMAQGLRKSKLFGPAVAADKDGTLQVDGARLVLAHHTALSHLQREIDIIKKHRKGKQARA